MYTFIYKYTYTYVCSNLYICIYEYRSRQSAAFESKSIRDPFGDEIKRNCAPGPGQYEVREGTYIYICILLLLFASIYVDIYRHVYIVFIYAYE
jgi:hypothetical protein